VVRVILRIQLINGDSRRGKYLSRDAEAVRILDNATLKPREIRFSNIKDITDAEAGQFEACIGAE